jgi:putative hydrolase of the HAD superfamily
LTEGGRWNPEKPPAESAASACVTPEPGRGDMTWVLFDYGGVICRPQPEADVALLAAAAGGTVQDFSEGYWAHRLDYDRAELNSVTYWQKVGAGVGRTYSAAEIAELTRLIEDLAAAGHRLALLSNAPSEVADAVAALPVAAYFEHCTFSCYLPAAKPDPECYQAVLALLGASPAEVVFLDDRPENVAGAKALGIRGVRFAGAGQARAALAGLGVTTCPSG